MILSEAEKNARKTRIMEACFACYCEHGLNETGMKALGKACGMNHSSFYNYFDSLDELIVQSTAYGMKNVAQELMTQALSYCPDDKAMDRDTVIQFMHDIPHWAAEKHGKKYRFMYQVYSSPKYLEYGRSFFREAHERYASYAALLSQKAGIPEPSMCAVVFAFARAAIHFAMFGDEGVLNAQLDLLAVLLNSAPSNSP